jgi:hypothetical protein
MYAQKLKQPNDDTLICHPQPLSPFDDDEDCLIICYDDQKLLEQTEYEYIAKLINRDVFFNVNNDNSDSDELYMYFSSFGLPEAENAYVFSELTHKFFEDTRYDIDHNIFDHDEFCKSLVKCLLRTAKQKNIKPSIRIEYDLLNLIDTEFDKWIKSLSKYIIPKFN